eukprot:m.358842 g.358842  ORF g.358842 m.358842 type:complete len:58 (+) comp16619_c0_seq85:652-825(+)
MSLKTLDDGPEIIDGLIKGCESLGGSVGTVLGHVKLKDVIEIVPTLLLPQTGHFSSN